MLTYIQKITIQADFQQEFDNESVKFISLFEYKNRALLTILVDKATNWQEMAEYQQFFKNAVERHGHTVKIDYWREMFNDRFDTLDIVAEIV